MNRNTNVSSVAVLPLLDLEESQEDPILGQELADALITKLSLSALIVRPTSSVLSYTSRDRDPLAVGRQLRVDAVLDGMVGRHERLYRITLRLLRVRDGRSIWAGTFNAPLEDVFSLQETASEQIVATLFPQKSRTLQEGQPDGGNQAARFAYLLLSGYGGFARVAAGSIFGRSAQRLALIAEDYDLDWSNAEAEYKRAIQLGPRYPTARHF